jgi:hypothetical protein
MADQAGDSMITTTSTSDSSATEAASTSTTSAERTFTQEQVDRLIGERLARAKAEPPADYADLKTKAAEFDKLQEAQKTELEKLQERAVQAEQQAAQIKQVADQRLLEAAVLAEATRQKAIKPEHLHRLLDMDSVTVGDDGQVTGVQGAVKAFLDANPEYVGTRAPGSADQGARGDGKSQLSRDQLRTMSPAEIVKAQSEGRLDHLLRAV